MRSPSFLPHPQEDRTRAMPCLFPLGWGRGCFPLPWGSFNPGSNLLELFLLPPPHPKDACRCHLGKGLPTPGLGDPGSSGGRAGIAGF